ncbi:MAG: 4Fe-4S binding protein [Candidatus Omnitrophica bacterium]|nr:4Fe-4S binding protein [Candidatus Omnitrophota bacterium]
MATDKKKKPGWKTLQGYDLIIGGGTAKEFKTGDWRTKRPLLLSEKCIHCLACWVYCPDSAVIVKDGKVVGFDYSYCKGCGICAHECPVKGKAIKMIPEKEAKGKEGKI